MSSQPPSYVQRPLRKWQARLTPRNLPAVLSRLMLTGTGLLMLACRLLAQTVLLKLNRKHTDTRADRVKQFLEFMGGAWIKFGQQLSIRIDFVPEEVADKFTSLLDKVPPFNYETARTIFMEDFGTYPEAIFEDFHKEPVASASFGQVYLARLNGKKVAIKVQRPRLKNRIVADVLQMKMLGYLLDGTGLLGSIRFGPLIAELTTMLEEEADYAWEKANIHDALNSSRNFRIMKVPDLYPEHSSDRIITMEFLEGIWVNDMLETLRRKDSARIQEWESQGLDFKLIGRRIFDVGMRQLFEVQKFNADPHAANIVIIKENVIGYVDYGLIGAVGKPLLNKQRKYFEAIFNNNADAAASMVVKMIRIPRGGDARVPDFQQEMSMQIQSWLSNSGDAAIPLSQKSTARLLIDNIALIRKYRFSLANNLARYYRALITTDLIILQLDRDFDFSENLRRYFTGRLIRETRRELRQHSLQQLSLQYFLWFLRGPEIVRQFAQQAEEGGELVHATETRMKRWLGTLQTFSFVGLLIVLVARVFGVHDVGRWIGLEGALDWRWTSLALYIAWRSLRAFGE